MVSRVDRLPSISEDSPEAAGVDLTELRVRRSETKPRASTVHKRLSSSSSNDGSEMRKIPSSPGLTDSVRAAENSCEAFFALFSFQCWAVQAPCLSKTVFRSFMDINLSKINTILLYISQLCRET